ncbi:FHA domain-containing protein [bacterium]|nr:FHA domain-containing protein [bacterium]
MKISNNRNYQIISNNSDNQQASKKTNIEQKQVQGSANELSGNYNVAFFGLFNKKEAHSTISDAMDVRYRWYNHVMRPGEEYLIDENSKFTLGQQGYTIDLSREPMKTAIKDLRKNESIVIGREAYNPGKFNETKDCQYNGSINSMDDTVSRRHLEIKRTKRGELIAKDLNSMNGTIINKNIFKLEDENSSFHLNSGDKYILPYKSVLMVGNTSIIMHDLKDKIMSLKEDEVLTVGSKRKASIVLKHSDLEAEHIRLRKAHDGVMVENIGTPNSVKFAGVINKYQTDYSNINTRKFLIKGIPTKVPNASQIYLGCDLTLDVRNKNLLKELEKKGTITVGRGKECDFVVPDFYNQVSRKHLKIEKDDNDIIVTDLGSMNGTEIIPQNCIKPFYGDLRKLAFRQSNIGDCYLLANLYALSQSRVGRNYLENMVRVDNNGNYIVKFSFEEPITIRPDELDGQKAANLPEKKSVSGDLGIKAIERAYGRMLKEKENTFYRNQDLNQTLYNAIDEGGYVDRTLFELTGISSDSHCLRRTNVDALLYSIERSGIDNNIITCTTPEYGKYDRYVDPDHKFIRKHAYAVKHIDSINRTISIVNPHNTKLTETISWDEFSKYFDYLYNAYV